MTWLRITMLVTSIGFANIAYAEDDDALLVIPCTGCHTSAATLPSVFGRPAAELESTMLAIKSGDLESTVMVRLLRGYSNEEIARLAKTLASMPSETASRLR